MLNERLESAAVELTDLAKTLYYLQGEFFMDADACENIRLQWSSVQALIGVLADGIGRVSREINAISDLLGEGEDAARAEAREEIREEIRAKLEKVQNLAALEQFRALLAQA